MTYNHGKLSIREATGRIERYCQMRKKKPINQLDDQIHGIHFGTEWEAELRLSDLDVIAVAMRNLIGEDQ